MRAVQIRPASNPSVANGLKVHVNHDGWNTVYCGMLARPHQGRQMVFVGTTLEPNCKRCLSHPDVRLKQELALLEAEKVEDARIQEATAEAQEWEARQNEPTIFDDTDDELSSRMWELMEATLGVIAYDVGEHIRTGLLSNPLLDLDKSKIQVEVTVQYGANKWVR